MTCNNNERQSKKSIVLELISDKQLSELKDSSDVLFTGKVAAKSEGGFKKLYELPSPALLERCTARYTTMTDVLSVRIKHHGWLCDRDSGWSKNLCILFANHGLLFVYTKQSKGYVLKMSYALQLELYCGRKKILPTDKPADDCSLKLKYGFGSIEIKLMKNQVDRWRVPLIKAFDAKLPCFEPSKESQYAKEHVRPILKASPSIAKSDAATPVQSETSISSSNSLGLTSLFNHETTVETVISTTSVDTCDSIQPAKSFANEMKSPKPVFISTQVETEKISPKPCPTDSAFSLPVYRLETEREKKPRGEPPKRIAEKIRFFETLGNEASSKEADKPL